MRETLIIIKIISKIKILIFLLFKMNKINKSKIPIKKIIGILKMNKLSQKMRISLMRNIKNNLIIIIIIYLLIIIKQILKISNSFLLVAKCFRRQILQVVRIIIRIIIILIIMFNHSYSNSRGNNLLIMTIQIKFLSANLKILKTSNRLKYLLKKLNL